MIIYNLTLKCPYVDITADLYHRNYDGMFIFH